MSRTIEVPCTVDIENSFDSLHAHAIPEGVEIAPGDTVIVHAAPPSPAYGDVATLATRATVIRAGWLERQLTPVLALAELSELFNVGFEPARAIALVPRGAAS